MTEKEPALSLKGIRKVFPGVVALDNVSIDFYPGEVHALIGENGAGKSTFIKAITGAHAPDGGTITVDGETYSAIHKAKFFDNMTHQMADVTAEIRYNVDKLCESGTDMEEEETKTVLKNIEKNGQTVTEILNDLLNAKS